MPLSDTDIIQDIPSEYTIGSLDGDEEAEKLMECLLNNICIGQAQQPDGWDGHIFREFIIQDYKHNEERKNIFKEGFKIKGNEVDKKVNITWTSFNGIKNRAPSRETVIAILEWKARCDKTPLKTLLGKFVAYCGNTNNRLNNPDFFKAAAPITEIFKSELK